MAEYAILLYAPVDEPEEEYDGDAGAEHDQHSKDLPARRHDDRGVRPGAPHDVDVDPR